MSMSDTRPKRDEIGTKIRVSWTIDPDVLGKLEDIANGQRDSVSGMANRVLAVALGLMPRQRDSQWIQPDQQ